MTFLSLSPGAGELSFLATCELDKMASQRRERAHCDKRSKGRAKEAMVIWSQEQE